MTSYVFKMLLTPDMAEEYRRRQTDLWPEFEALIKQSGVRDYALFLDREANALIGVLPNRDRHAFEALWNAPAMGHLWSRLAGAIATHPNNEPVVIPLEPLFELR